MNYQLELEKILKTIDMKHKPRLLLHACCAPCSSYCLEYLSKYFNITLFYYNPNIDAKEEFQKRLEELKRFVGLLYPDIEIIDGDYNSHDFEEIALGLEDAKEGGTRCFKCYELRLSKTAMVALEHHFDYFGTTLSISPYKNASKLNSIGLELEKKYGIKYLTSDFKKQNGYVRSIELSKKYNLYRQDYCGCKYSKLEREKRIYEKNLV